MSRTGQLTIRRGEVIPGLTLPDSDGREVSTRHFYLRRNLVLAVLPRTPEPGWSTWVQRLGEAAEHVPDGDAAFLLVTPVEMDASLRASIDQLPESISTLFDGQDLAGERFGTTGDEGLLVVTDRYGVAFVIQTGAPNDDALDPAGVPDWIEFIACQCS